MVYIKSSKLSLSSLSDLAAYTVFVYSIPRERVLCPLPVSTSSPRLVESGGVIRLQGERMRDIATDSGDEEYVLHCFYMRVFVYQHFHGLYIMISCFENIFFIICKLNSNGAVFSG